MRVRVHPVPEIVRYEAWSFPDFVTGADALRAVTQTGTGPTVVRLSDEAETGVNLATTEPIGESQHRRWMPGHHHLRGHRGARRQPACRNQRAARGARRHVAGRGPARAWERGRFGAPYLRDSLLAAGALCETFETATDWSNLAALKSAVTEALTTALAKTDTPALVMCHISHVYPTGASLYFTVVAGQRGNPIEQWKTAKTAASDAMAGGGTITHHHAVGADHRPWMGDEIGDLGVEVLRAVKACWIRLESSTPASSSRDPPAAAIAVTALTNPVSGHGTASMRPSVRSPSCTAAASTSSKSSAATPNTRDAWSRPHSNAAPTR